jgi:hypothetical protein
MKHTDELWMKANTIRAAQIANGMDYQSLKDIFAELIVQECIEQVRGIDTLRGTNDDMLYGADIAAVKVAKHFGVDHEYV